MWLPKFVRKLVKHTDKETSRYALSCVHCEADEGGAVRYSATCGKQLITVTKPQGGATESGQWLIEGKDLDNAFRAVAPRSSVEAKVSFEEGTARISGAGTMVAKLADGRFPRLRDVFTGLMDEGNGVAIDANFLKMFAETVIAAKKGDYGQPKVFLKVGSSPDKPLLLYSQAFDGEVIRGVVMPLAADNKDSGVTLEDMDMSHHLLSDVSVKPEDSKAEASSKPAAPVVADSSYSDGRIPA